MTVVPPQQVQIRCPNCGQPFRAAIYSYVDVGQQPELKTPFLVGQLNMAICPNCGVALPLATDTIYHDPEHQLFLAFSPQGTGAKPEDQERFVGQMAQVAIRMLPPDAPKGYLLAPKRFLTMDSLIDTVLEADGVSREQFESQIQKVNLIYLLANSLADEEQFAQVVAQFRPVIDEGLLALLDAYIGEAQRVGRPESVEMLVALRERLQDLPEGEFPLAESDDDTLGELIEQLAGAPEEQLAAQVAEARGDIDYGFFEAWTARIAALAQAGEADEAERLTARRQRILELVEQLDRQEQERFERASALLQEVVRAEDAKALLRERREQIDDAFMFLLETNEVAAERANNTQLAAAIAGLRQLALEVIEESLTPEDRLISQLLAAETPQESTRALRQNAAQVSPALVKRLNELADDLDAAGRKDESERVRRLAREAGAMLF
jgi:hypothetical protein